MSGLITTYINELPGICELMINLGSRRGLLRRGRGYTKKVGMKTKCNVKQETATINLILYAK